MVSQRVLILGLESSCDETAAAVVADGREVLSNIVASQIDLHQRYGGVVPEIAARAHIEKIIPVLHEALTGAMEKQGIRPDDLSAVAVAHRPGLTPALIIAVTAAKTLAWAWNKPLIAVDHIHAHLQAVLLEESIEAFPAVALIVSGGHTTLFRCHSLLELERVGQTLDDAAGEAFDKVAAILQLPYPGGPSIEKAARNGDPHAIKFPRTYLSPDSLDFSFSGIKTAVLYHCRGQNMLGEDRVPEMSEQEKADIAASFQAAVIDVLVDKTIMAARRCQARTVLIGGGVAANSLLREQLARRCEQQGYQLYSAQKRYCTDNAAMVAGIGYHYYKAGRFADLTLEPQAGSV